MHVAMRCAVTCSITLAGVAMTGGAAGAATVSVQNDAIVIEAGAGEYNYVQLSQQREFMVAGESIYVFSDEGTHAINAGAGCSVAPLSGENAASCPATRADGTFRTVRMTLGDGNDRVEGGQIDGPIVADLGPGDDEYGASGGAPAAGSRVRNTVHGGTGLDRLANHLGPAEYYGGDDRDVLSGWSDEDLLDGGAGPDLVVGFIGDDVLRGGDGDDDVVGDSGDDSLSGGAGIDRISGGSGDDLVVARDGNAEYLLHCGDGIDRLLGDPREPGIDTHGCEQIESNRRPLPEAF